MSQQLLLRYDRFDADRFDAEAEARAQAGLTLLQLWIEGSAAHWALFTVNDAEKAQAWMAQESALGHGPSASHMLTTA
ncbi:hypothetical protein CLG85_025835 [Yangia mangrovi]|uniref:Uncharacterized protein n=1 Tax=Alloyangia mangrovi TaxID=1779329 RepID=A0A2A3JPM2_9RHOB|nr:hypothetical protein [Alloyangia mangrovi]MCA0939023.1 hypothetical protein [Alloyangia pacifica]MCA0944739.1 hypothetical protein [Alloyangia pacifica]MCT4373531.1 hypothetical protein [Alloyangia mangrovi]